MNIGIILSIIGALISLVAVIFIYGARVIVKERFSFGDQNTGVLAVKIVGILLFLIGMLIIFFNLT